MPPLSVMFKTVSSDCNLDCGYCYYRGSQDGARARRCIEPALLERFMPQYMEYVADTHQANLSWQGGEPTLAGLDFFRRVVQLEAQYARPPMTISNAIQTNGVLIDDEWAQFLAEYRFLVGVSMDGPQEIHDSVRKDRGGQGSFRRVMAGIEALRRHGAEVNALCVIGPHNVYRAGDLMRFFRAEGTDYLQFIPAMDFQSTEPQKPPAYLVTAVECGEFLKTLFDEWYQNGIPAVSMRLFDNLVQSALGIDNDLCVHSSTCDAGVVVESNGDVFPCDFYVHPEWRLGNVLTEPLEKIAQSAARRRFVGRKQPLRQACQQCAWLTLCKGECPRNRMVAESGGVSYFCRSYRMLFSHAAERIKALAIRLAGYRRYLQWQADNPGVVVARTAACPCGSEREYKSCCGEPSLAGSYLVRAESAPV